MSTVSSPADGLPVINERAAGIDIGSRFHVVPMCQSTCHPNVKFSSKK